MCIRDRYISDKTSKTLTYNSQKIRLDCLKSVIRWCQIHRPNDVPTTEIFTGSEYIGINRKVKIDFIPCLSLIHIFVEIMACRRGCIMGGGQPVNAGPRTRKARMKGLYDTDINTQIKKSNENPMILSLYEDVYKRQVRVLLGEFSGSHGDHYKIWPHGQAVKTSPFHGGNTSSNLVGVI